MGRSAELFVLSGPSGVGKGTLLKRVLEQRPSLHLTVSATTRRPRANDVDGVSYHFLDDETFSRLVGEDAFLEWAVVHGKRYGTLRSEVDPFIERGTSVILEIDVQGALAVRARRPGAILIFVEPPSMEELERRLRTRATEDEASIRLRLAAAREEMARAGSYDARIVNDDLDEAAARMIALIDRYETVGGTDQDGSHQARDRHPARDDRA
ncbi:MAG: guanylate kinase [Acidobacteriota bacterium]|nr:guanylate kinase [Acidobacteriota bacterium]